MVDKIAKEIQLDLSKLPKSVDKKEVKNAVGEYVVGEILKRVSGGVSPVSGERFKRLSKEYADREKFGDRTPNLELEGDMLNALEYKRRKGDKLEVGIFNSSGEVPKADGHNNFSGDSKLPRRRFIPEEDQKFKREIEAGVKRIVKTFEEAPPQLEIIPPNIESRAAVEIRNLFEALGGEAIISREFNGEGNS